MSSILEKVFANFYKLGLFAFIFFLASVTFFAKNTIEPIYQSIYHYSFISFSIIGFISLLFFNKLKPVIFLATLFISYIVLNYLRNNYMLESPLYYNWGVFLSVILMTSIFIPNKKLTIKNNVFYILLFLLSLFIIEHASKRNIFININFVSLSIFCSIIFFIYSSIKNKVLYYGFFFAYISALLGYYFAFNPSAFTMFFGVSLLMFYLSTAFFLYYNITYNPISGAKSQYAFLHYSQTNIIKCSLALICIDNLKTLEEKLSKKDLKELVFLIAQIIKEKQIKVFHINSDDFIIIFEDIENIRRTIATTDFMLKKHKNPLKTTISASIVERRRSDANIFAVYKKAQKDLLKRKNFNNNFTSQG